MAIEEEFTLEISDADADKIDSVSKAIDYVAAQPDGASHTVVSRADDAAM